MDSPLKRFQNLTLTCILAVASSQAVAGGLEQAPPQEIPFHKIDTNRNCNIDQAEFNASFRTPGDAFMAMDLDADGQISKEEARASYAEYRERQGMNTPDASRMRVEIPQEKSISFWASIKQSVVQSFERRCTDWEKVRERREERERNRGERDDRDRAPNTPTPQPEPETPGPEPEGPGPEPEIDDNPQPDPGPDFPDPGFPDFPDFEGPNDPGPGSPDPTSPDYDGPPM